MPLLQDYESVLSKYREMINTISRCTEECINLAYELQRELLRGCQTYAHEEDLKDVYTDIQPKEETMITINSNSHEHIDLSTSNLDKFNLLKETVDSVTSLLHEVKKETEDFN